MTRFVASIGLLLLLLVPAPPALAQPARDAKLLVTVVDPSGGVIVGATVTVVGPEDATKADATKADATKADATKADATKADATKANATKAAAIPAVKTSDKGIATITDLAPGRYSIQAEFPGFQTHVLKDVRLRSGDNKHVVVLSIQGFQDSVTVGRDKQEAAADRRGSSFGTALTREQVDALSDDPDEMAQQLQEMAGPGAVIRVDSFEGGKLPPKAMIKSIHITRDAFAAENHNAGAFFIDIITQPGVGPMRGGGRYSLRDGAFSGRSPFTPTKGPERTQNYGTNFGGSLIKDRSSFNVSINGQRAFDTPNLNVALPTGTVSQALSLRTPRDNMFVFGTFDFAITKDQTLRMSYYQNDSTQSNLGVGGYNEPERAYANEDHSHNLRVQEAGPLGRRFFTNTRLEIAWQNTSSHSAIEAPTYQVNDAFTSGGAQVAGGRHTRTLFLASDLDYVRGIHSVRGGIVLNGGSYQSNDTSNYLGTYTFESLDAFTAGTPRSYTRRIGDPNIDYFNLQAGAYLQDDIRVRKGFTLSPGIRYEAQTHLRDYNAFGPRFGITWAPFKSGKTTLRASAGIFYDWLASGTYEQTLRVDGFRQQELNIVNPSFPDPGNIGLVPPTNRYLLGANLQMARNTRLSAGIDQAITSKIRIGATYSHTRGEDLLRGDNLNAPVHGVRPNAAFGNIIEVLGDAGSLQNTLNTFLQVSILPPSPNPGKERWNWKRTNFGANWFLGRSENNTDGAFSVPATGSLLAEWGPASNDVRQRFNMFFGTQALRNFSANLNLSASSATPYTIWTGVDNNGDQIFNDRPAGVGRNSARGDGYMALNTYFNYTIGFGTRKIQLPPGIFINGGPGGMSVQTFQMDAMPRFRLNIYVNAQNLTNHRNYSGFSGTMTSPFFGQPTNVQAMRKIDIGMGFNF